MGPRVLLCLLAALGVTLVGGCFDNSTGCTGRSPRVPPETYHKMVRRNQATKLTTLAANYSRFTDKVAFKEYCKQKNVNTLESIAVYDQADCDTIDFHALPASFVIKSNKGSSRNLIVRDGVLLGSNGGSLIDRLEYIRVTIRRWGDPYVDAMGKVTEPWYEHVKPKILIEQLLSPVPDEIKVWVINNTYVDLIQVASASGPMNNIYDADLNRLPYHKIGEKNFESPSVVDNIKNPEKIAELHRVALTLAADVDLDIMRIDLYHLNDRFYGRELTLCPYNGGYHIVRKSVPKPKREQTINPTPTSRSPVQNGLRRPIHARMPDAVLQAHAKRRPPLKKNPL